MLSALALAGCAVVDRRADRRADAAEAAYPPEGEFVTVAGRRVHYVTEGSGPDLILLHGASGNTRDFTFDFVDRVKDRYRVTVFDRPGLGYTDRARPGLDGPFDTRAESAAEQAALLAAAARKLGLRNPIVLGHSYGGAVAMAWALNEDPAAIVVVSGATEPWSGRLAAVYGASAAPLGGATLVPLISAFATAGQLRMAVEAIFAPQTPPPGYLAHIGAPLSLRRDSFRANARQVGNLRPELVEMAPRYGTLTLPVEIVHGTADRVVPIDVHAEVLLQQVPSAHLTRLEGVGHMPHHAAPEAVVAAIDRAARRAGLR
jgi:pimeloyl-ACP methyl ester carboxylesterase